MAKEKKKMQSVSFRNIDEFLAYLPEHELLVAERLRELVFECIPHIKEKLSYNVPFYSLHKSVCYFWAGSVAWGKKTYEGVEFGFQYGNLLHDPGNYLDRGTRKQVFFKRFLSVDEMDEDMLRTFLFDAAEVDEMMYREKMMKRKKR